MLRLLCYLKGFYESHEGIRLPPTYWFVQSKKSLCRNFSHRFGFIFSSTRRSSCCVLKILQNSQENTWTGVSFSKSSSLETCNFIKTETPIQVFFCEFWKSFKNTYFLVHLRTTASENWSIKNKSTVRSLLYRIAGFLVTVSICSKKVTRSC